MAEPIVDAAAEYAELRTVPEETGRYADLRPHPENYQEHPPDQIEHLKASLVEFGVVRKFDTPLRLKPDVDLAALPAVDNYGMKLTKVREPKSDRIRKLVDEYEGG